MPEHTKSSAPMPTPCTPTTCGCACIAATTAVSAPASTAGCLLPSSSRHTPATRAQAPSATRASATPCARSVATAATTPICSTSSQLGGASCWSSSMVELLTIKRRRTAAGHDASCAACSAATPDQPQPSAAPAHSVTLIGFAF
eukprot:scaffold50201_cov55-Phaeocystis_antarctica.AAC.4